MKRLSTAFKSVAAAAVVLGAFGAASAHAATDVFFSVSAPGVYVQSGPAYGYVRPAPVYVQPQYGQVWRPAYQPQIVYERDGWRHHRHQYQNYQRTGAYGDYDRDGVPNRWDRAPANPYRR